MSASGTRLTSPRSEGGSPSVQTRLLAIAAEHLRRLGPKGVTVVGVAGEAGMTHANVYRYFPSKVDLVEAVAGRWLKDLERRLGDIADGPDPADDKLERLILGVAQAYRELLIRDPHLFDVAAAATETSRAIMRKHRGRVRQLLDRIVDEGIATGLYDPRDRERAIGFVLDASHRFINPVSVRLDADLPQDLIDVRLAAVLRAAQRVLSAGVL